MRSVGVRELKAHAAEILRRVRVDGESVEVTYRGRIVARLVPTRQPATVPRELDAYLARVDEAARRTAALWPYGVSSADAVREQRRDL